MITIAVTIFIVLFALGSVTPLLLTDETDTVVERKARLADETAESRTRPSSHGTGTLAVSRPHYRRPIAAYVRRPRRTAAARAVWLSRRAG